MQSYLALGSTCAALLAVVTPLTSHAETWNYGTRLGLSSEWNDNPALVDNALNPESTFRFLASYDGEFERQDYNTRFNLRPRVTTDYYPDSQFSNLQSTDYFLPGSFSYQRPTRVWTLGFNASQQSVLSSEASTSQGVTIGLLEGDDKLTQFSLSPSLTWQLSERDELLVGLSYGLSDYDLEFTNRTDSTSLGANISYRRSLNERNSIGITTFISSSDADRKVLVGLPLDAPVEIVEGTVNTDSSSNFITADYRYALSTTSSLSISYGLQDATTESTTSTNSRGVSFGTGSLDFSSTTYDVGYQSEGPRSNYSITASRSVTLDITSGQPQDRDELTFEGEYEITERLLGGWRLIVWEQEAIALAAADDNTLLSEGTSKPRYADVRGNLSWRLTRKWSLTGAYQYRWRSNDVRVPIIEDGSIVFRDQDLKATSSNISIGLTYLWKELQR